MACFRLSAFADEYSPDFSDQIKWLTENNLDLIELRGVDGCGIADISDKKAYEISSILKENNISISAIGSPIGKINIKDDFTPHFEKFRRVIEIAKITEADKIRIFSFYIDKDTSYDDVRNEVLDRLIRFSEYANAEGITLCHENEKGIYGNTPLRCLDIFKNIPDIKAVFDPANFVADGNQSCINAYEILKNNILYMHIKDSDSSGTMVPAGEGEGDIPAILSMINKNSKGEFILTLEPHLLEFSGLSGLERAGERSFIGNRYKDTDEAFGVALNSLNHILEEI